MGTEVVSINKYDRPNWVTIIAFGLFHIGAVAALFFFTWKAFWVSVVLYWLTTNVLQIGQQAIMNKMMHRHPVTAKAR